jgi:hypothetical protein
MGFLGELVKLQRIEKQFPVCIAILAQIFISHQLPNVINQITRQGRFSGIVDIFNKIRLSESPLTFWRGTTPLLIKSIAISPATLWTSLLAVVVYNRVRK